MVTDTIVKQKGSKKGLKNGRRYREDETPTIETPTIDTLACIGVIVWYIGMECIWIRTNN